MKVLRILSPALVLLIAAPLSAEPAQRLSPDQIAIVYQQCLARAAMNASRTELPDEQIYPLAHRGCIPTRIELQNRVSNVVEGEAKLKAIEAEAASTFADRTRKVRERRREFEAQIPKDQK